MMNRNTIRLTTIVVSFSYLFLLQFLLQNIFIDPIEARMGLMNKLKLLALLTLVKKVDVVPLPLPIPIPIHIDTKDEYIYLDSMGHRPPQPYPPSSSIYYPPTRYSNYVGYSASELSPVMVAPEGRPLRYGDRISSHHHNSAKHFTNDLNNDPSSTYRIRKVNRNRQSDSNGSTSQRPRINPSSSSSMSTTKTTPTSTTQTTTTTTPLPSPPPSSTPIPKSAPIENDDQSHPLNENVDLKDIKIIFIPVKNLQNAIQNSNNNEMQSDMQKFGEEISKQLKDLPFGDDDDEMRDGGGDVDLPPSHSKALQSSDNDRNNKKSMDSWNMIDSNKPKVLKNHYTVEQPITTVTTAMPTTVESKLKEKPAELPRTTTLKPPTTSQDSGSPFPIPSLQTRWQQQNSYVPKASYYRAPELKVVHSRAQPPESYQNNQPKDLEWSITPDLTPPGLQHQSLPDLKPNHIQFLYSITHSNETPPNLQNYVVNRPAFQYPAAGNFGLESFRQNQYRRRPLLKSQQQSFNNPESLMQSSSSNPVRIQPKPERPLKP